MTDARPQPATVTCRACGLAADRECRVLMELVESTTATKDLVQWTEAHEGRARRGAGPRYEWSIIKLDEEPGPDKYPYLLTRWGNPQSDDPIKMTQVTCPHWGMDIAEAILAEGDRLHRRRGRQPARRRRAPGGTAGSGGVMTTTREQMQSMRRAELIDDYAAALDKLDRIDDGSSEALRRVIALAERNEARGDTISEYIATEIRAAVEGTQ